MLTYFGPIWGQKGPEDFAHSGKFSHMPEITHNMTVNQVSFL